MSIPATCSGARYSSATRNSSGPLVTPASTNSTNRGHASVNSSMPGAAANASSYALDLIVPWVPITPIRPFRVCRTAARTAGWMTSTTGMPAASVKRSRASRNMAADAVLQAMTSIFTPESTISSSTASEYSRTSAIGFGPYGECAVSPT